MNQFFLFLVLMMCSIVAAREPVSVLIVTGGHDFERTAFFAMFAEMKGIQFTSVEHPLANAALDTGSLANYDVLLFYDMNQSIDEDHKSGFISLIKNGKGLVFLHHSLASYQEWDEFSKIRGGKYILPESLLPEQQAKASTYQHDVQVHVKIIEPDHPVCRGLSDFVLLDEVYGGYQIFPFVTPLLKTNHPLSNAVIAWSHVWERSRIVFIQPGHDHHAFENSNYRKMVENAINWTADRE
ncbi:MAG: ThuA domain-containing protein [Calditrichaeota bacterium]|nr:MAG: ThuA domain-containing protein [Calditrichota bacterium]